jgi:hypothetical protein
MQVLRKNWRALLVLVLLLFGAQAVSSSVCVDQAFLTVLTGPGKIITATVRSPDQDPWEGWVTMTVVVHGETFTFSYPVSVVAGGSKTHRLVFSGTPTLYDHAACEDPDGMTESPEPVAIVETQE